MQINDPFNIRLHSITAIRNSIFQACTFLNVGDEHILQIGYTGNSLLRMQHLQQTGMGCREYYAPAEWNGYYRSIIRNVYPRVTVNQIVCMQNGILLPRINQPDDSITICSFYGDIPGIPQFGSCSRPILPDCLLTATATRNKQQKPEDEY